jgi:hypothetical protein
MAVFPEWEGNGMPSHGVGMTAGQENISRYDTGRRRSCRNLSLTVYTKESISATAA